MAILTTTNRTIAMRDDALIADLASLVRRMSYALKRAGTSDALVMQSVEFLKRNNLGGNVLREQSASKPWFSNDAEAIRWMRDEARQWVDDKPEVAAHLFEAATMFERRTK